MKAALIVSQGRMEVKEVPRPVPAEGEVLVKLRCCGVCGTDVEKVHGAGITTSVLGHETVGEVVGLGPGRVDDGTLREGTRVFAHHHVPCYQCETCKRGKYTYCPEYQRHNLVPCGLAQYFIVPKYNVERGAVIVLPDGLGYEEASFIEPLACCILGLDAADARNARSALVYGAGPVGLLHLRLLRRWGVRKIAVADVSDYRLAFAQGAGADMTFNPARPDERTEALKGLGSAVELAVVATASPAAFEDALGAVARAGTVLMFGAPRRGTSVTIELSSLFLQGTRVVTSYAATERETHLATRLLAEGAIEVSDLVTHRFPLESAQEAFATAGQQRCVKALIVE